MTNDGAAATIGPGEWGSARHGKSAVGCRGGRDHRHRLRHQREPRRGELAAGRHRLGGHLSAGAPSAQGAGSQDRLRRDQSRGRGDRGSDQGRHVFRVRLYRRRPAAVRAQGPGDGIQPRLPGAARGPADERAVLAVVLLGHHAADRARIFLGARAHAPGRRRRRAVDRGQHLRRPGRGAIVHPALSRQALARGNVRGDDRRHGRHRRHGVRALCDDPHSGDSRCRRPHRGRLRCSARRRRS